MNPPPTLPSSSAALPVPPPRSFWQRRFKDPVLSLLTQGVTPDTMAFTFALGTGLSLFPFFGFTTLLNAVVGVWLRLNQPLLQTLNYVLSPVHLAMILVYVRLGEWIWRDPPLPLSVPVLLQSFREQTFLEFLQRFGWAGIHAFTAWAVTLPFLVIGLRALARPILRRAARTLAARRSAHP
ncbi:MAG TPA: DUF2062 domain-containing protein [Opitutaceae bacterium]|nr:DUF2062 domain-containing protein [Opitutaceae bacterium]